MNSPRPDSASKPAEEEARLLAALEAGDESAMNEMRRWVRGAVSPYRFRLAAEIEDLEQEVALELIEALAAGRFEGRSLISTYVRRMVHHKCLNRLRARRGKQWVDLADASLVDPEPLPYDVVRRRRDLEVGLRVLALMPEHCRELWAMIHRGMGYEAMGGALGVAAGTLRVRVLRCREKALAARAQLTAGGNTSPAGVT